VVIEFDGNAKIRHYKIQIMKLLDKEPSSKYSLKEVISDHDLFGRSFVLRPSPFRPLRFQILKDHF